MDILNNHAAGFVEAQDSLKPKSGSYKYVKFTS